MAESPRETSETAPAPGVARGRRDWRKWLTSKWLIALIAVSLGLHLVGYWYYRNALTESSAVRTPEITLGDFQFEDRNHESHAIEGATFKLHVSLLSEVEGTARGRLAARQFKVQQGIEELLRQAHAADFDDPNLSELKRLLQEQVNEAIGLRAVGEVIITDLEFRRAGTAVSLEASESPAEGGMSDGPRPSVSRRETAPLPFSS